MAIEIGIGGKLTFNSIIIGNVVNITIPSMTRESVDVTHLGTTAPDRVFIPGLIDPGEITFDGYYDSAEVTLKELTDNLALTASEEKAWVVTMPDGTTNFAGNGFVTSFTPSLTLEGPNTYSATIKVSGAITPPAPA